MFFAVFARKRSPVFEPKKAPASVGCRCFLSPPQVPCQRPRERAAGNAAAHCFGEAAICRGFPLAACRRRHPGTRAACTSCAGAPGARECRSPVSRILSTPCEAGRPFLSPRRGGAPCLRRVRLIPGNERAGSPFPVLSCTTRGLPCRPVTRIRGGLLLHHFTLACAVAGHRRYLSAALSVRVSHVTRPSLS